MAAVVVVVVRELRTQRAPTLRPTFRFGLWRPKPPETDSTTDSRYNSIREQVVELAGTGQEISTINYGLSLNKYLRLLISMKYTNSRIRSV